jgi:hypothetical protein
MFKTCSNVAYRPGRFGFLLSVLAPPAAPDLEVPGCGLPIVEIGGCSWQLFESALRKAVDPAVTSIVQAKTRK